MATLTRRKYPRYSDHVPILFAGYSFQSYSTAVMHNSCVDGMYFESDAPLKPKFEMYIKIQRPRPIVSEPEPYKAFRAKVKWCRQVTGGKKPRYGIGAQFTAKSHLSYGLNINNSHNLCDFCEKKVTERLIHQTEIGLLLCLDCCNFMETLPGSIEESLERFLLGNVV
ncbi:MAG: hypothetical protein PVH42_18665 [Desulfobacterales bacterium]|jgi:hypothetical protein